MTPQPRPDDYAAMSRTLKAKSEKAAQLGRGDLALQYHIEGMKVRDQLRQRAADAARAQYEATGDVGVYVPFINDYMPGDVHFDAIRKEGDGYVLSGSKAGQQFQTRMRGDDLRDFLGTVANPDVQRALEAKRAEQLYQMRLEQAKKGPTVVAPGSTAVYPGGQTFTAPEKPETKIVKNADGSESVVMVNGGQARSIFGGEDSGQAIPKPVRDMQKESRAHVFKLNGVNEMSSLDSKQVPLLNAQQEMVDALISSSYRTDNWSGMSPGLAASIAYKFLTMDPKDPKRPVMREFRHDGSNQPVRLIEYDGRIFPLDPFGDGLMRSQASGQPRKGTSAPVNFEAAAAQAKLPAGAMDVAKAIFAQESGSGSADTSGPNNRNVRGPMQVKQETFEGLRRAGLIPQEFQWSDPQHNTLAGLALIKDLYQKYDGDPRKVAAAYYSGEKAVTPTGEIRDFRDPKNPRNPTTFQYVDQVTRRIRGADPSQVGLGTRTVSGTVGRG